MKIESTLSDDAVLAEVGHRLSRYRIDRGMTQAELADEAGIAKRTLERIEAGEAAHMSNVIRIFRVLGLLEGFDQMIPEPGPRPMDLLKLKGKERKRASSSRRSARVKEERTGDWTWGDES